MHEIPQLVWAPLNPIPIAEHFRRSHPPCEHSHGQHIQVIIYAFFTSIDGQIKIASCYDPSARKL